MAGHDVTLRDDTEDIVADRLATIEGNYRRVSTATRSPRMKRRDPRPNPGTTSLEETATGADLVVEAVPENLEL